MIQSDEAAALIRSLFVSLQELNNLARRPAEVPPLAIRKVGILGAGLMGAGFATVDVSTVQQTIVFPSVLDYVRFQIVATPMTVLLKDKTEPERQSVISSVASTAASLSTPAMLGGGKFTFPQEAYVAIAWPSDTVD